MTANRTKTQKQKFIDTARELGADEDERAFDEKLKRLAKWNRAGEKDKPRHSRKK